MPRPIVSPVLRTALGFTLAVLPVTARANEGPAVPPFAARTTVAATPDAARGPVVHLINDLPDEDRGPLTLARPRLSFQQAADGSVTTSNYWEQCTEPCNARVDVSERPVFVVLRNGVPVSTMFRIPSGQDEVTLRIRPRRLGLTVGGMVATSLMILPIGIPMLVFGAPKIKAATGAPSERQRYRRIKPAKF